jgi:predicted DNA-binding transcriptional regulator YafY
MSAARLFDLLALLQRPRPWPASELAARLEASPRTIRRDVERLRALGYPVEATMGAAGGYRLVAGGAMPPLVLDDEEAIAIVVGLRVAAAHAVHGIDEASVRALAKVLQVLPTRLRQRVGALAALGSASLAGPSGAGAVVDPDHLTRLAAATEARERVGFDYAAADGTRSERRVEPYGLVAAGRRWYVVGFDVDRDDWRTFRLDRLAGLRSLGGRGTTRALPARTAGDYLVGTMLDRAPTYEAVVTVHAAAADARARLGDAAAEVEEIDARSCRVRLWPETAEWLTARLLALDCDVDVHEPPELVGRLRTFAARLGGAVDPGAGGSPARVS